MDPETQQNESHVKLETILVPVDFSAFSAKALDYAIAFAAEFGARLVLVTVVETALPTYDLGYVASTVIEWDKQVKDQLAARLNTLAAEKIPHQLPYLCLTQTGEAAEEILAIATDHDADLIIMGTHGRTGVKHMFLGSVAEKTVRSARCPVLVVRSTQRDFVSETPAGPRLAVLEILAPVDFSEGATHALKWAEMFAQHTGARLNLLHVVPFHYALGEYDALEYPQLEAEMMETGRDKLSALAEVELGHGLKSQCAVVHGAPRHEILQFAVDQKADLVVMGTRGLTGIKHLLLGSTAEYVIRHAACAVLTVPDPTRIPKVTKVAEPSVATV